MWIMIFPEREIWTLSSRGTSLNFPIGKFSTKQPALSTKIARSGNWLALAAGGGHEPPDRGEIAHTSPAGQHQRIGPAHFSRAQIQPFTGGSAAERLLTVSRQFHVTPAIERAAPAVARSMTQPAF